VGLARLALPPARRELVARPGTAVLYYHRIAQLPADPWSTAVTPDHFEEHLQVLRKDFHPVSLREFVDGPGDRDLPQRSVAVTFDDGYADNLAAVASLERHNVPGTLFATSGALESDVEFWWDQLERIFLECPRLPAVLSVAVDGETMEWRLSEEDANRMPPVLERGPWRVRERPESARQEIYLSLWTRLHRTTDRERRRVIEALGRWAGVDPRARPTHRSLTSEELLAIARSGLVEIGG